MLSEFAVVPMFERKTKPQSPQDMDENVVKLQKSSLNELEVINKKIQELIESMSDKIQISKVDPAWIAYINHVDNELLAGLSETISTSLSYFINQIDNVSCSFGLVLGKEKIKVIFSTCSSFHGQIVCYSLTYSRHHSRIQYILLMH